MKQKRKRKPAFQRRIAKERIEQLFIQAESKAKTDMALSDRYVDLAMKISMKYKVKIPRHLKRRICKTCHSYLIPGKNCRIRLTGKTITYYCSNCRNYMRFGY